MTQPRPAARIRRQYPDRSFGRTSTSDMNSMSKWPYVNSSNSGGQIANCDELLRRVKSGMGQAELQEFCKFSARFLQRYCSTFAVFLQDFCRIIAGFPQAGVSPSPAWPAERQTRNLKNLNAKSAKSHVRRVKISPHYV